MWCHLPTGIGRRRALFTLALTSLFIAFITTLIISHVSHATAGINKTINFQGRLLTSTGATVPDGYYNIQFKIYQDGDGLSAGDTTGSPSGSLKWTESYINNGSPTGAVQVKNGFLSVNLGSINPFGGSVDWNQDTLFLSMNVAGTATACTTYGSSPCTADGEMLPMKRMTTSPYALQADSANKLGTLTASNFVQLAQGVQTDASSNTSSIFINKTSTGNLLQLQNTATDVFTIGNAGDLAFGNNANHTLSVTTSAASTAGKSLTISSGTGGSGTGSAGGDLVLQGGAAGGTSANGGNLSLDAGAKTGTGTDGALNIGTSHASTIQIGSTSSAIAQTINIGTNNTASSSTDVTIGAGSSASAGATAIQSKNNTTVATNGITRATFDTSNNLYVGNGITSGSPNNFTIASTGSSTSGVAGANLSLQGGAATSGNANGGDIVINGGANAGSGTVGKVYIGNSNVGTIQVGSNSYSSGTQSINVGTLASSSGVSTVTIGSTTSGSTTTIQGGTGGITLTGQVSASSTINATSGYKFNGTSGATTSCSAGYYVDAQVVQGGIVTGGTCTLIGSGSATTLQNAYNNSGATPLITLDTTGHGMLIRDASSTVGGNLFAVQNNAQSTNYFAVTTSGASVAGTFTTTGNINNAAISGGSLSGGTFSGGSVSGGTLTATAHTFGQANSTIGLTQAAASTTGGTLSIQAGQGGTGTGFAGGALTIQGGNGGGTNGGGGDITVAGGVKTGSGTSGNVNIATNGVNRAIFDTNGNLYVGNGTTNAAPSNFTIQGTASTTTAVAGASITIQGGAANTGNANGGDLTFNGGAGVGTGVGGNINIGTTNTSAINIGTVTTGTTNVTIGSSSSATGGTTAIQSKGNTTISTNGVARATFDTSGNLYVGNGATNAAPANFTIQGTTSTTTAVSGGALTIQGGGATTGNANGGNLTLSGGAGVGTGANGLVVVTTPTFQTAATQTCASTPCTITQANVDNSSVIVINTSGSGYVVSLPNPTISGSSAYGRLVYVTSASTADFTLAVNGGVGVTNQISMRNNTSATMVWGPGGWTAAGASSSTTMQAAYDNTLQSAGGAELVVAKTSNTNGLTIRDSSANPVNGALLSVQSNTAANLFSVSSNLAEYASDPGAETAGASSSTFPSSTWAKQGNASVAVSRNTTAANIATGQGSVSVTTTANANDGVNNLLTSTLTPGLTYNVSFTALLSSGTFNDLIVDYSKDGSATTSCATAQQIVTKSWTKISCSFTVPTGSNSSNAMFIRQNTGVVRTFYVDNLSVTAAASQSYVTDGGVDDNTNFATNYVLNSGATITRSTSFGNDASDSVQISTNTSTASGAKNKLAVSPLASTGGTTYLYRVTAYVQTQVTALTAFTVQYSRDNGTNFVNCVDYNTQAVSVSSTAFTKITCIIQTDTTAASNPYLYFEQGDTTARNTGSGSLFVDTMSMTIANSTTPNVQVGGGINGGPTTLFTLDKGAGAPIANDNTSLLGSMYYDTTLGKIQCFQASGWGSCGAAPDNIITISPEYTNAVMHGTGVGTMTSDLCSNGTLSINTSICASGETYNYYNWTSPQSTAQAYSIYVTYQLPSTFKSFNSGSTKLVGRVDNTTNASVVYQIYVNTGSALTACGGSVAVTSSNNAWQTGTATGSADPSTCAFVANSSILFKITVSTKSNSNAYVGNIGFAFSNR